MPQKIEKIKKVTIPQVESAGIAGKGTKKAIDELIEKNKLDSIWKIRKYPEFKTGIILASSANTKALRSVNLFIEK